MRRLRILAVVASIVSASLGVAPVAIAGDRDHGVTPGHATPVQREQAQSRFAKGKALYAAGKYAAALTEFSGSLDLVVSPNTRLYVARCLRELGKTVPAYVEFGRAAVEAREQTRDDPRYEKTAESASEERARLQPKLGFVNVTVEHPSDATTLDVAHDEIRRGGWSEPIPVLPGTTEVVVATPGSTPITRVVSVGAGETKAVAIDAGGAPATVAAAPREEPAPPPPPRSLRPYAYVAGGVALAGLATFAIAGAMANGSHSDLEQACGAGPCPPGREDAISAGKTEQTIANVGLVVFGVSAVAAVTLWVLSPKDAGRSSERTGDRSSPRPTPTPTPTPVHARVLAGPQFVGLGGTF